MTTPVLPTRATPLAMALGLYFSMAPPACAADQASAAPMPMPTVTVHGESGDDAANHADSITRSSLPLADLPASIQVVPRALLRERGVIRTDALLDTVSGVLAESSYGGNGATFFNIRGFSENNGLRDGFRNYGYLAYRDVQNIERVEVFKGPAGALYGGVGALGGYVNTVSKRPQDERFGEAGLMLGSAGLARATLDVNTPLENGLALRLNAAGERNAGFRDDAGQRAWSLAPALSWRGGHDGRDTTITLLIELNHLARDGFDFGLPNVAFYQALARTRYYGLRDGVYPGQQGDFGNNDTGAATLLFTHTLNARWTLRMAAHYSHAHQVSRQSFPDLASSRVDARGARLLDYAVYSGANEASRQYAVQAELAGTASLFGMDHAILAGVDDGFLAQGGAGAAVSGLTLNLDDARAAPAPLVALAPAGPYHQARGKDLGLYVQDLVALAPRLKLHLGLRADRFENRELLGGAAVAAGSEHALSPRVGLVWHSTPDTAWFADWSRSHAPNVAHSVSNAVYDAEAGTQVEAGVKQALLAQRLHASLAAFRLVRANILTSDPLDATRQVLSGRQQSRGVEFDLAGTIAPGWRITGAYTWLQAVVASDTSLPVGAALSNVPRHHASAWTSYDAQGGAWHGLGLGAGLFYVGAREANLPTTYRLPGYVRADALLSYRSGAWRTQLNVLNLFDRRYVTGGAASVFNYTLAPGAPRAAQLSVGYRF